MNTRIRVWRRHYVYLWAHVCARGRTTSYTPSHILCNLVFFKLRFAFKRKNVNDNAQSNVFCFIKHDFRTVTFFYGRDMWPEHYHITRTCFYNHSSRGARESFSLFYCILCFCRPWCIINQYLYISTACFTPGIHVNRNLRSVFPV